MTEGSLFPQKDAKYRGFLQETRKLYD